MVFAEDIKKTILEIAGEHGPGKAFHPSDVARRVDNNNWQSLLDQVSFVALVLEREGKVKTRHHAGQIDSIIMVSNNQS